MHTGTLFCGVGAACIAEHWWTYCNVSLLPLPLDQELHNFDGIQLILSDCLELLQAVNIIPSSSVSQQWFVDLLTRPATMNHEPIPQHSRCLKLGAAAIHACLQHTGCGCPRMTAGMEVQDSIVVHHTAVHT